VTDTRVVEVKRGILEGNDARAARLRTRFAGSGTKVINLVSSPGTGKTALLEELLRRMDRETPGRVAALVGDCATDNDAVRLARSGAPVRQIVTEGMCHLEADLVEQQLDSWGLDLGATDVLFIENVGNLVCPAAFDLGESLRVVLLSVTEGEDKPLKYPSLFSSSDLAIITKTDLSDAVEFNAQAAYAALESVRPGIPIVQTSARTGAGIDELVALLRPDRTAPHRSVAPASVLARP
jgi:hydrogenase nickel incorporation protein HypB